MNCPICEQEFKPKSYQHLYCSPRCKAQQGWKLRQARSGKPQTFAEYSKLVVGRVVTFTEKNKLKQV